MDVVVASVKGASMDKQETAWIVVGTDGSFAAASAVRWAVAEAGRRRCGVHLVYAYGDRLTGPNSPSWSDPAQEYGQAVLAQAVHDLVQAAPGLVVTSSLVHAHPITALAQLAEHAVLVVVGAHGESSGSEFILGSIASRAISHLPGVVVVVRSGAEPQKGPIIVGLDGSAASEAAIEFAFEEATLQQLPLTAVRVWDDSSYRASPWSYAMIATDEHIEQEEGDLLRAQLDPWKHKFPEVIVTAEVLHGRPATAILDRVGDGAKFRSPSLIVVGSRGHSGLAGRLAGSTSNALIAHSRCPVAVVHPQAASR